MAFDGLCLRAISCELKNLIGYKIDKIFEPNKNNIVLGLYGEKTKFALNICIDSKFYRMSLTTHPKPNPIQSLNFCMLLRKHITGYKIKSIINYGLERIVMFELEPFDEFDTNVKYLIVELMGKHSNIILANKNMIIIDSIRHTNTTNNSYRNIFPRQKYELPKLDKLNIEDINDFNEFYSLINNEADSLDKAICAKINGLSMQHVQFFMKSLNAFSNSYDDVCKLYNHIKNILKEAENCNLHFEHISDKDFGLCIGAKDEPFDLNFFIDDFYYEKEASSDFIVAKNNAQRIILDTQKKLNKRLSNMNAKLADCNNMDTFRLYGELLTANLYKYNSQHLESVNLLDYTAGKNIDIPLDKKYTVNENCKRYFKKYNKLKNALDIVQKQKEETLSELDYIESIVFELDNATTVDEINTINDEIRENVLFKKNLYSKASVSKKKSINKKQKKINFNPLTFNVQGYTVLVGRNNKENDWLTTKYANSNDLWFHTKDIHGSHVILKTDNSLKIDDNILLECAKLAALHSKAKSSSNVPVDYTQVKFVKKPNGAMPGMVIYTHNKTLYVTP